MFLSGQLQILMGLFWFVYVCVWRCVERIKPFNVAKHTITMPMTSSNSGQYMERAKLNNCLNDNIDLKVADIYFIQTVTDAGFWPQFFFFSSLLFRGMSFPFFMGVFKVMILHLLLKEITEKNWKRNKFRCACGGWLATKSKKKN